jgi:hypothetical protein
MVRSVSTTNPVPRGSGPHRASSRALRVIRSSIPGPAGRPRPPQGRPFSSAGHRAMQIVTLSRGIRGAVGFPRAAAHAAAAVLAVTAMLAAIWVGPVAAASADTQLRGVFAAPAPVKFYIVPPPGNGPAQSLFTIAAKTLGDGSQFMEIFNLNRGRLQPNGGRLTNPRLIEPGWILQLPADAAGPGVRFGPLPVVTAPASHRPSRSAGMGSAIVISAALALLTAGLAFTLFRRRAGRTRRRRPAHLRAPGVAGRASRRGLQHDHDRYMGPRSAPAPPTTKTVITPAVPPVARPATEPVTERKARPAARPATKPGTRPASGPAGQPGTSPAPKPGTRPASGPADQPGTSPAPKPGTRPARRPEGRPRQLVAIRVAAVATAALFLFACVAGTTEVALHGFPFFVFRSTGTGETGRNGGLQEDQGPGQPDAPKPAPSHIKARLSPHRTVTVHHGQ